MNPIKSPLSDEARSTTGKALQTALVDLLDLTLQAKQAHWNLIGKHFRSLHLQLDEVVDTTRRHADEVAERAVAIGVNPDGRVRTIADSSKFGALEPGYLQDDAVVTAFIDRLSIAVQRIREGIDATEKTDLVSQDLLIGVATDLEMHLWMFQAQR